ncbi:hypothetical protein [Glycomyces sp. NPDC048151]|uniref:hypothetical protein n=1 Tax=Glycomyces sp. NPDC048151 TaxID=3364002 RepID=UPI003717C8C3
MTSDDAEALALGLAAIAVFATWPVLPGLRRFGGFKTFPPFRAWAARPHPDAAVRVRTGRRPRPERRTDVSPFFTRVNPSRRTGADATVVVRIAWSNQDSRDLHPSLRASRPLVPLLSVDGRPAAWGWGTVALDLPPGRHLIAVTSSHSRWYRVVHLNAGDEVGLDYASILGATAHFHRLPGAWIRELTSFGPRRAARPVRIPLIATGAAVVAALAAVVASQTSASALVATAFWGAVAVGLGSGIAVSAASLARQARSRRVTVASPPDRSTLEILDADGPRLAPAPGWAGLGLHLRFDLDQYPDEALAALCGGIRPNLMQRWRTVRIGEPEAPACRPWIPVPEVTVDGVPLDASWTRMWTQLAPGEHELAVKVGPAPEQVDAGTLVEPAEFRTRFRTVAGENTELTVTADITAIPARDRPRLTEFRARLHY